MTPPRLPSVGGDKLIRCSLGEPCIFDEWRFAAVNRRLAQHLIELRRERWICDRHAGYVREVIAQLTVCVECGSELGLLNAWDAADAEAIQRMTEGTGR